MWSQDDAVIKSSVTNLSYLCPVSTSKSSMSFLNNTFENDFEIDKDIAIKDIANKEELIESSSDTEKEGSEVEITLEVHDLEKLVDNSRDCDIKTEADVLDSKLDTDNANIYQNFDKSDKSYHHEKMVQQPDKLAKKKKKTSSQKRKWPEDPADCDICGTHYTTKRSYQRHYKIVHELIFSECKLCGAQFRWRKALNIHMNEVHLGIFKTYKCDQCDKVSKEKQNLRRHKLKYHPPPSCDFCKISFKTLEEFNEHLRKEHIEKYCV